MPGRGPPIKQDEASPQDQVAKGMEQRWWRPHSPHGAFASSGPSAGTIERAWQDELQLTERLDLSH